MGKKYHVYIHLGAWLIMILPVALLMFDSRDHFMGDKFLIFALNTLFTILNFYLFFSLLIPWLYDKKLIILVIITLLFLIFYPLFQFEVFSYLRDHVDIKWRRLKYRDYFLSQAYTATILYTGLSYLARFTIKWVTEKQKQTDLINQNQTSELALLKSQINPHFLFNTLNNIYSLVLKKSDKAPAAMMKLSEIMRYMLYETNVDKVPLDKEIMYLKSFIELLQLRLKQNNFILFETKGDTGTHIVAPMLLVPFVENAFKHCDKNVKSPGIKIKLEIDNQTIYYKVINYKKENCKDDISESGGIGLQNIKRRLNLLYPEKHKLEISETEDRFEIYLELEL